MKKQLFFIIVIFSFLFCIVLPTVHSGRLLWNSYDLKALDVLFKLAEQKGLGPQASFSPQIIHLNITDDSYNYFAKNILDRGDLARVNLALSQLAPQAVAYDIIFARRSTAKADQVFAESLDRLGVVFLPIGLAFGEGDKPFSWEQNASYERFKNDYLASPVEHGKGAPTNASRALMQYEPFALAAMGSGDISTQADSDSVYRHVLMVVKVDHKYFPSLSLAMFLDWAGISLNEIIIDWGKEIIIPAAEDNYLENDVIIPIDEQGRAFVPFVALNNQNFQKMAVHELLEYIDKEDFRGNLLDLFEGNFVLIADVASGAADLGDTPLEKGVTLVNIHASTLNGLLTGQFYQPWPWLRIFILNAAIFFVLICTFLPKSSKFLYVAGLLLLTFIPCLSWFEFTNFRLMPMVSISFLTLLILFTLIICKEISAARDRTFIRQTFSRYVPEKVVTELLQNPNAVKLGGEKRVVTVLFTDLADFTKISEKLDHQPQKLISLLNEYLNEMSEIIFQEGGIIDKYQGDAIMAEFGIPLKIDNHADLAVIAALQMQNRLQELNISWRQRGLPALRCRIGLNTGEMVVGNIGSNKYMDYTVIGDSVNLSSRLEGANKRYGTDILISEFSHEQLTPSRFLTRPLDIIKVKGKEEAVKVYEVYGRQGDDISMEKQNYYALYQKGFNAYLARKFTKAENYFSQALALNQKDLAAIRMIDRCIRLNNMTIADDWDGSTILKNK